MGEANKNQIGGRHYKSGYEHWDLVLNLGLGYLEGCTTKYVTRWRKKLGMEDLKKAAHYLEKLIETLDKEPVRKVPKSKIVYEVNKFALINELEFIEEEYIMAICTYTTSMDLVAARCILDEIMEEALLQISQKTEATVPGTPEDGGHHAA